MRRFLALTLLMVLGLLGPAVARAQTVTGLQTVYRNGQVFITFQEVAGSATYNVYRHTQPVTNANLSSLTPVVTGLKQNSGTNLYTGQRFIIDDLGQPLAAGKGLLVLTTGQNGTYYYAVTNSGDSNVVSGTNATPSGSGVTETVVSVPGAVLLSSTASSTTGSTIVRYFAWEDYKNWDHTKGYYGYPFNVVRPNTLASNAVYPLTLVLHSAGTGGYMEPETYGSPGVIVIHPRDNNFQFTADAYTGLHTFYSAWFGFKNVQDNIAYNYTERRVMRYLNLVKSDPQYRVDPERIYVAGSSMGSGAMHLASHYPGVFAAVSALIGWVDLDSWGVWNTVYGLKSDNVRVAPAVDIRRPSGQSPALVWDWQSLKWMMENRNHAQFPPIIHGYGFQDTTIPPDEYPAALQAAEATHSAMIAEWKDVGHTAGYFAFPENASIYRFILHEAFPAFSASSNSSAFGGNTGQRNLYLDWSSSRHDVFTASTADSIVDTAQQFRMTFKSLSASDATVNVTVRNAQQFLVLPQQNVTWENRDFVSGIRIGTEFGTATADALGLVTVPITVKTTGNQLILSCPGCTGNPPPAAPGNLRLSP